jgi:hypothetical protein
MAFRVDMAVDRRATSSLFRGSGDARSSPGTTTSSTATGPMSIRLCENGVASFYNCFMVVMRSLAPYAESRNSCATNGSQV